MIRTLLLFTLVLPLGVSAVAAQQDGCTYDECALRVKRGFWGPRLVQGLQEEKVAGFAFVAPPLTDFLQRSDSALRYYTLFRSRHNRGLWLMLGGTLLVGGAQILHAINADQDPIAIGIVIGGAAGWVIGAINIGRSQEPLSKTVWWYNRTLVNRPPP